MLPRGFRAQQQQRTPGHTPLQNLPFEGYIQSNSGIELSRLHNWMKNARWINKGGKLIQCDA
jgi:hypothetical protein